MLIKWAKGNTRRLVLLVSIFILFTGIAIELTVRQYCVCSLCEFVGKPPEPCHCTSLASHYLRRAMGRNDFDFDSTNQNQNHRIHNNASISQSQSPCSVGGVAHP
jgi:hypothetical protein